MFVLSKFTRILAWIVHLLSVPLSVGAVLSSVVIAALAVVYNNVSDLLFPGTEDKEEVSTRIYFLKNLYDIISSKSRLYSGQRHH